MTYSISKYLWIVMLGISLIWCASCSENTLPDDNFNASENFNRSIIFDVYRVYSISPLLDSTVRDVTIDIFYSYEDLMLDYYPDASRITDSLGHAEINGLDKDYYYIRASHPALGNLVDSVNTPAYTTSFVYLYY
jgi:hypothetical protein